MYPDNGLLELLPLPYRMLPMLWCVSSSPSSPRRCYVIANNLEDCEVRVPFLTLRLPADCSKLITGPFCRFVVHG